MRPRRKINSAAFALLLLIGALSLAAQSPGEFVKAHKQNILSRLMKPMRDAHVPYPPKAVRLAVFKEERKTELWLPDEKGQWKYVKDYGFSANSGKQGPKIYYGDLQIPEGVYGVDSLGLSKEYHLALHLDHPNAFDLAMLELDGRDPSFMSTGINVHGGAISYGCVVIGNRNIEEFFMLAYLAGKENTKVFIFPHDTDRTRPVFRPCDHCPVWYAELQRTLAVHLAEFKR